MEHRRFKRNILRLSAQLITSNDRAYHAHVMDISPIGMRVVVNKNFPEQVKVMDVLLSASVNSSRPAYRMPMFVVHKQGMDMGLCLVNEADRIDIEGQWLGDPAFSGAGRNTDKMSE